MGSQGTTGRIRIERIRDRGTGVIILSGLGAVSGEMRFTLRRFDTDADFLGPDGWSPTSVVLVPRETTISGSELHLIIGPEVSNHIVFGTTVEIATYDGRVRDRVSWPEIPVQRGSAGTSRVKVGTGRAQQPSAGTTLPPASSPTPLLVDAAAEAGTAGRLSRAPTSLTRYQLHIAGGVLLFLVVAATAWFLLVRGAPEVGTLLRDCPDCPELVVIPAGHFSMGSPRDEAGRDEDEGSVRDVTVTAGLAVGKFPVTRAEFQHFVAASGYGAADGAGCKVLAQRFTDDPAASWRRPGFDQTDRHPVVCVSWDDARAYVKWLSETTGKHYRLPSEAEREFFSRAGTQTPWHWGANPADACRYANTADQTAMKHYGINNRQFTACEDGFVYTAPVDRFSPNSFQLYGVSGNVFEWVADCYHRDYSGAPVTAREWTELQCSSRVVRGGSWTDPLAKARSAARVFADPAIRSVNVGFRVVRELTP